MKKRKANERKRWFAAALLLAAVLLCAAAGGEQQAQASFSGGENTPAAEGGALGIPGLQVFLDGEPAGEETSIHPGEEDLRVYITWNGMALLDLPFAEEHTVWILQPYGGENTVTLTGTSVSMTEADCDGQDCVQMGEITRDNLEMRVMGGFIICLPHRISVEVR